MKNSNFGQNSKKFFFQNWSFLAIFGRFRRFTLFSAILAKIKKQKNFENGYFWLFSPFHAILGHFWPNFFFFAFSKTPILAIFEQFENRKKQNQAILAKFQTWKIQFFLKKTRKKANFFQGQVRLGLAIFEVRLGLSKTQVRLGLDNFEVRLG